MIVAGEASGDLHGSNVVKELKALAPGVRLFGIGGDRMKEQGVQLVYHCNELSFMGFSEVIRNISLIRSVERTIKTLLDTKRPRAVVLIDFPGMNLRIARYAKERRIPVIYYILPQVWAWGKHRLKKMRKYIDRALVILPFEEQFFRNEGVTAEFVGHPILDLLDVTVDRDRFCRNNSLDPRKEILALFPGSRRHEVHNHIGVMVRAAGRLGSEYDMQPVIGVSPNFPIEYVRSHLPAEFRTVPLLQGETYNLMHHARIAFVKSGTSTLEAACFKTPMVVVYKTSAFNFFVGRMIVDLKHFSLVNILAGEEVVTELSQRDVNPDTLYRHGKGLLDDEQKRTRMIEQLSSIRAMLGERGASRKVAFRILEVTGVSPQVSS
jgi:lipid-A-disaccharide synthase